MWCWAAFVSSAASVLDAESTLTEDLPLRDYSHRGFAGLNASEFRPDLQFAVEELLGHAAWCFFGTEPSNLGVTILFLRYFFVWVQRECS